ncbi:hypothetical protein M1247_28930 [Mycobacterium sp. 21AC1]|uniref:hypothetical protein n=1 Tax=[Mycobacterium] appelbergii TaxID=2939269 RepID=UPI0029392212|nr:hypothetical protein [Mycobacterium sp. 21AC1]MDV3128962.1 hypothetical protein [Mycobacterium sp. 21AC1]
MTGPQADLTAAPAAWARTAGLAETLDVGPVPRVDSFEAFSRVFRDDEGFAWWVPAIGWPAITGCAGVAVYALASAGLPWQQGAAAPFIYILWLVLGLPGAIAWVWYTLSTIRDVRGRPRERRDAYARWQRSGVLTRSCPVGHSFRPYGDENPRRVHVLIRPETDPRTAHRLLVSARGWLRGVEDDAAQALFRDRHVIPTEDIFGADARGGYLTDHATWNNWILLLPPEQPDGQWTRFGMSQETARALTSPAG